MLTPEIQQYKPSGYRIQKTLAPVILILLFSSVAFLAPGKTEAQIPAPLTTCGQAFDLSAYLQDSRTGLNEFIQKREAPSLPTAKIISTDGEKYFPKKIIESVWGSQITSTTYDDSSLSANFKSQAGQQPTLDPGLKNSATCTISFSQESLQVPSYYPPALIANSYNFESSQAAQNSVSNDYWQNEVTKSGNSKINKIDNSKEIGDHYIYTDITFTGGKQILRYYSAAAVENNFGIAIVFYNESERDKADNLLAALLQNVSGAPARSITPPPVAVSETPQNQPADPVIDSFTPGEIPAGVGKKFDKTTGQVYFEPAFLNFEIKGKNLEGAVLTSDNIGTDGKPGLYFQDVEVKNNGTYARGHIISWPTAMNQATVITLTNQSGRSTAHAVQVTITGTQYLQRKFKNSVIFAGDWKNIAPNERVDSLANQINAGLSHIELISYRQLNILPVVYEESFWNSTVCGADIPGQAYVLGCASPLDTVIRLREGNPKLSSTLLHESAHKLHFFYLGSYKGVPGAPNTANAFPASWKIAAGKVAPQTCSYLPLKTKVNWKDGTSLVPHCGMIQAYGATDLQKFYEDIATMTESYVFNQKLFSDYPEPKTDPRYIEKTSLLKKYEFLP